MEKRESWISTNPVSPKVLVSPQVLNFHKPCISIMHFHRGGFYICSTGAVEVRGANRFDGSRGSAMASLRTQTQRLAASAI
jgi:hypothetical protein